MAKNIKHSKIKNTGVMFELLVRQVTSDTLNGMEKSPALKIVNEYFNMTIDNDVAYRYLVRTKYNI